MKEGIGFTATINIITIFIVVTFGFLSATLMYYKAYKVNNAISDSIEKYEGYNDLAKAEIDKKLETLGYLYGGNIGCRNTTNQGVTTNNNIKNKKYNDYFDYCIKYQKKGNSNYYNYKVTTFLKVDIPLVNLALNIPVRTTTENIYYFSED